MNKITLVVLAFFYAITINSQNEYGALTYNKAINISGKQRMLSQKVSKLYLHLLENTTDSKAKRELLTSKIVFEKQNEILLKNTSNQLVKDKINEVLNVWKIYTGILDNTPNVESAKKIINTNTLLLNKTNEVVKAIIAEAKINSQNSENELLEEDLGLKNIINTCGKQRMLSQRLALYYIANNANLKSKVSTVTLKNTFDDFNNAITELLICDYNNNRIEEVLGQAMTSWEEIKNNESKLIEHTFDAKDIYKKTNDLTKLFNKLTSLYEKVKIE